MNTYQTYTPRRFCRSTDRALIGGVCAGVADYFGLNLRIIRVLAIIAFFVAMPMAVIAYLAIVFLVPARAGSGYQQIHRQEMLRETRRETRRESRRESRKCRRAERKRARREAKQDLHTAATEAAAQVRSKCQALEQRLASLEKYITSSRYQLDREFRNL